jgi:phosphopantothenoylcysteine decarboxylase/phosphopantothenate--cysteine ligase
MGFSLAREARLRGAEVTLITGAATIPPPHGVRLIRVETASEMREAVFSSLSEEAVLIMTAAVADFCPGKKKKSKIKKQGKEALTLNLVPTPDILAEVGEKDSGRFRIGFAAETGDIVKQGKKKLEGKNLHLIVANDVSSNEAGFSSPFILPTIIERGGSLHRLPRITKEEFARRLIDIIEEQLAR